MPASVPKLKNIFSFSFPPAQPFLTVEIPLVVEDPNRELLRSDRTILFQSGTMAGTGLFL